MYQDNIVLCGASAYEQKYYFNEDFSSLPDHVKKESADHVRSFYRGDRRDFYTGVRPERRSSV